MGARALIRAAAVAAALVAIGGTIAPPGDALVRALVGALAIALGLHGLGRIAGRLARDRDPPIALAIAWGLAAYVAIGGALAAVGMFDRLGQEVLLIAGVVCGSIGIAWRADELAARVGRWRFSADTAITLAIALLLAIHVLGAAGARHGAFVDGDGDLLGPLARLDQTGELPDAIGAPRASGLGGTVIATSLAHAFGDARTAHAVDGGLGLALALALVLGLRRRGGPRAYTAVTVAALALGLPNLPPDLAPRWIVVALGIAAYESLRRARTSLAVLCAAALTTITYGGLGVLVVIVVIGRRRAGRTGSGTDTDSGTDTGTGSDTGTDTDSDSDSDSDSGTGSESRARLGRLVAIAIAVIAGYLIALLPARAALPATPSLLAPGLAARAAIGIVAALVLWALFSAATRHRADRALAITIAGTAASIAAAIALSTSPLAGALAAVPFAIAILLVLAVLGLDALAASSPPSPLAVPFPPIAAVAALAIALALGGLRFPLGVPPRTWSDREADVIDAARAHLAHAADVAEPRSYRAAQDAIPAGARVGHWVDRADLLDYRRHQLVDLRGADAVTCRAPRPRPARLLPRPAPSRCRALAALPARLRLRYLVLSPSAPIDPADPILALAATGRPVATAGDLLVVELP